MQRLLRQAIAKQGRQAILLQLDQVPPAMRAEAEAFGAEVPPQLPLSVAEREAALDDLLRHGVTAQWEQAAAMLESAAEKIEARGPVQHVGFQARDADTCSTFRLIESRLSAGARIACSLPVLGFGGPMAGDFCAAAFGAWLGAWTATCAFCGC